MIPLVKEPYVIQIQVITKKKNKNESIEFNYITYYKPIRVMLHVQFYKILFLNDESDDEDVRKQIELIQIIEHVVL
jgi:hypothetical protein